MSESERLTDTQLQQLADLLELGGTAENVLAAERHLTLLFGRRPRLRELVDELIERRRLPAVERHVLVATA